MMEQHHVRRHRRAEAEVFSLRHETKKLTTVQQYRGRPEKRNRKRTIRKRAYLNSVRRNEFYSINSILVLYEHRNETRFLLYVDHKAQRRTTP